MAMADIMERKGYYNDLVMYFEELREKRDAYDRELHEGKEEKLAVEGELTTLGEQVKEINKRLFTMTREQHKWDRVLEDLEAGGTRAQIALRRLQQLSVPPEQRATTLRDKLLADVRSSGGPPEGTRLGGAEAVGLVQDFSFPGPDGQVLRLRCYSPAGDMAAAAALPMLVFFHGEAYITGDLETHDWFCRSLAATAEVTVAAVDYRRAPEVRFPGAFEDAYTALQWVADGGLGLRPPSLAVGGDSAGGALAVGCCLRARAEEGPSVEVQVLFYPWLDLRPDAPSMQGDEDAIVKADWDWCRSVYAPLDPPLTGDEDEEVPPEHPLGADGRPWFEDWRASPLLAESLTDLPPAFVAYAEDDVLACESARLVERLRAECGHQAVHTLRLQGPLGHGFAMLPHLREAQATISAAGAFTSAALRAPTSPSALRRTWQSGFPPLSPPSSPPVR